MASQPNISWTVLAPGDAEQRHAARLQMHYAARVIGIIGRDLLPHVPRYLERSLSWQCGSHLLLTDIVEAKSPFRLGLNLSDGALVLTDREGLVQDLFSLDGEVLAEAYAWLRAMVHAAGLGDAELVADDGTEMEPHPVADGGKFSMNTTALQQLEATFSNAASLFERLRDQHDDLGDIRCWPHHFDLSASISLGDPADHAAPSIGIGMAPGDTSYADPYYYVTPYPIDGDVTLHALEGGGKWRTEGWTGAVLTWDRLTATEGASAQTGQALAFLESAISASRALVKI